METDIFVNPIINIILFPVLIHGNKNLILFKHQIQLHHIHIFKSSISQRQSNTDVPFVLT